ncbi:MAG TPA: cold shock domain-containing protein [Thermomicrobiales bacterium]
MPVGTVKVWSKSGGYGWIKPEGKGDLVYVHKSGVVRRDPNRAAWLEPGERVEYQMGQRPKGPAAINVRVIEGESAPAAAETPAAEAAPAEAEAAPTESAATES